MNAYEKQQAFETVVDAARIHATELTNSLSEYGMKDSFRQARISYINRLHEAVRTVSDTRYDDSQKVAERVSDLDLAELVALQYAVEDRIRQIIPRSPLA